LIRQKQTSDEYEGGILMLKRTVSLFCCLCIFTGFLTFSSSASAGLPDFSVTKKDWDTNWDKLGETNTNVCLTPGSDETELNFAWHCPVEAGNPKVKLSKNTDMSNPAVFSGTTIPADEGFLKCSATATGLEPNTVYYYTYGTDGLTYGPFVYRTTDPSGFKFMYINDIHQGYDANNIAYGRDTSYKIHTRLNTALAKNPDISFILSGGDQIRSGYIPGEWNALLASPVLRSIPIAFAIGNHDKIGDMMKNYINNPNAFNAALPSAAGTDYWFRYGSALFLVFDSTNGNAAEHIKFAKEAVGKNLDAQWRIGMLHHDLYTPVYPLILPVQAVFEPIIDAAGLDILLRGHSHIYGRSRFIRNGLIVNLAGGKASTNPGGTAYISMNAFQNDTVSDFKWQNIWTAKRVYDSAAVYSTFEVSSGKLVYKAFSPDGILKDEYTIIKTAAAPKPFKEPGLLNFYSVVKLIGYIYALFDYNINS